MRRPDIGKIVFDFIWQEPRRCDVQSWEEFIRPDGQFIAEVREERIRFYGPPPNPRIPSLGYPLEAQYPGLDYNNPWHRMRLSIGPWHRVIFKAFDALRLTADEIDSIMTHEGTKFHRQQYERQHGVVIRDTTGDDVRPFVEPFLVPRKSNALGSNRAPARRLVPWDMRRPGWRPASPYPVMRVGEDLSDSEGDEIEDYIAGTEVSDGSEDGGDEEEEEVEDHEAMYDGEDMFEDQEEDQDEEQDEDDNVNMVHVQQEPAHHRQERPAAPGPASNIQSFEEFLEDRYPTDFFPNGPPPASVRVIHTVHQILAGNINECVRIDVNFNHFQLSCWREYALERGHRLCNDGKWGFGLWRVPRHVTQAFYRNRGNTYAALEAITHPAFYNVDNLNFAEYNPRVIKDYINACFVDYDGEPVLGQEPTLDLGADDDQEDESGEEDMIDEGPTQPPRDALTLNLDSDDEEDENNDDDNVDFAAIRGAVIAQQARAAATVRMMVRRDSIRSSRSDSEVVARNSRDRIYSFEHNNGASQ